MVKFNMFSIYLLLSLFFSEISLLEAINTVLKERHEIETNYKTLSLKFTKLQKEETERRQEVDTICRTF